MPGLVWRVALGIQIVCLLVEVIFMNVVWICLVIGSMLFVVVFMVLDTRRENEERRRARDLHIAQLERDLGYGDPRESVYYLAPDDPRRRRA